MNDYDTQTLRRIRDLIDGVDGDDEAGEMLLDTVERSTSSDVSNQLANLLEWRKFLSWMDKEPVLTHQYTFRAHVTCPDRSRENMPIFRADRCWNEKTEEELEWNFSRQLNFKSEKFAEDVGKHLSKTRDQHESSFVSISPDLEWVVHQTGQRALKCLRNQTAGVAILSSAAISNTPGATLLSTERIFTYLDSRGLGHHVSETLRTWANNCQEHLSLNYLPHAAFVRWVPWTALINPPAPAGLLVPDFSHCFTLGIFRQKHRAIDITKEDYVARVICFAQALVGGDGAKLYDFVRLVVAASNWGYRRVWVQDDVLRMARTLIDDSDLE